MSNSNETKELTAMQTVLGLIEFHLEASDLRFVAGLEILKMEIISKELLAKEREMVINAFNEGYRNGEQLEDTLKNEGDISEFSDATTYFNNNYKQ